MQNINNPNQCEHCWPAEELTAWAYGFKAIGRCGRCGITAEVVDEDLFSQYMQAGYDPRGIPNKLPRLRHSFMNDEAAALPN